MKNVSFDSLKVHMKLWFFVIVYIIFSTLVIKNYETLLDTIIYYILNLHNKWQWLFKTSIISKTLLDLLRNLFLFYIIKYFFYYYCLQEINNVTCYINSVASLQRSLSCQIKLAEEIIVKNIHFIVAVIQSSYIYFSFFYFWLIHFGIFSHWLRFN